MSGDNQNPHIYNALDRRTGGVSGGQTSGGLEFKYDMDKLKKENRYRVQGQAFPKDINCFNWGACILPFVWGPCNNSPIALFSLVVGFVPYIGIVLSIAFSIYCGVKGNEWAWANKQWNSLEEFHEVQKKWAIGAIALEAVIFIIITCFAMYSIQNIGDNMTEDQIEQLQKLIE